MPKKLVALKFHVEFIDRLRARAAKEVKAGLKSSMTNILERGGELVLSMAIPSTSATGKGACRRCGHPKTAHWARGCLAGCPCSERRYTEA